MPPKWGARTSSGVTTRDVALWMHERRVPLGLGALAVFSAALGWWGYHAWRTRQEAAAQALMTKALTRLEASFKGTEGGKDSGASSGMLDEAQVLLFQTAKRLRHKHLSSLFLTRPPGVIPPPSQGCRQHCQRPKSKRQPSFIHP